LGAGFEDGRRSELVGLAFILSNRASILEARRLGVDRNRQDPMIFVSRARISSHVLEGIADGRV
jgi:hypothetical protein